MIIDRPTPATRNGLGNVIRGWPRWMLCQTFKKHKLCSSWRVKKSLFSGNCQAGCCLLHVRQLGHHTPHKVSVPSGFKAFLYSNLTYFIVAMVSHLHLFDWKFLGNVHTLFCNATPVPWRRVKKAFSVGIVKPAAACCTCVSLVIILHIKYLYPLVSKLFCTATLPSSLLPWCLICNSVRLKIFGKRPYSFLQCYTCAVTHW